ncbi:MAG: DUF1893 domain-containing protein [Oscillospiraceae bacterium]|jgi:hypothetical protein|nr:DUF1893 domain-containing protein [Oscillospiraceae bacterium]
MTEAQLPPRLAKARQALSAGSHRCVLCDASGKLHSSGEHGIRPPLRWLRENPTLLSGAAVADRVIGLAAAQLFVYGGVAALWAETVSSPALAFLREQGVFVAYRDLVPNILAKDGTALCPMERRALALQEPAKALECFSTIIQ